MWNETKRKKKWKTKNKIVNKFQQEITRQVSTVGDIVLIEPKKQKKNQQRPKRCQTYVIKNNNIQTKRIQFTLFDVILSPKIIRNMDGTITQIIIFYLISLAPWWWAWTCNHTPDMYKNARMYKPFFCCFFFGGMTIHQFMWKRANAPNWSIPTRTRPEKSLRQYSIAQIRIGHVCVVCDWYRAYLLCFASF